MTIETKHTPTPWAYMVVERKYHACTNHEEKEIVTVATVYKGDKAIARCSSVEDAAFIVRACNAHDELVKKLERGIKLLRRVAEPVGPLHAFWDDIFEMEEFLVKARNEAEIEAASSNFLDSFMMKSDSIVREFYPGDRNNQPNDHCVWDDLSPPYGWRETDEHLRARIKARGEA